MAYAEGFDKKRLMEANEWRARLRAKIFWCLVGVILGFLLGVASR